MRTMGWGGPVEGVAEDYPFIREHVRALGQANSGDFPRLGSASPVRARRRRWTSRSPTRTRPAIRSRRGLEQVRAQTRS